MTRGRARVVGAVRLAPALSVLVFLASVTVVIAQGQEPRRFEVTSVKASPPLPPGGARVVAGSPQGAGRWVAQNAPFIDILREVYPEYRLRGQIVVPDAIARTRFDIDARVEGTASRAQMLEMMKQLLAERFALEVRTEPRALDVQTLVVARRNEPLRAGLRPSTLDCEAVAASRAAGKPPAGPADRPLCIAIAEELPNGLIRVRGSGALLSHLVNMIQGAVREPIVDRTGLTARYDIDLEFNPELGGLRPPDNAPGSSLPTALQEQLGLRLLPDTAQLPVLVAVRVEMPTPD